MRVDVWPEYIMRDGQSSKCDVVQVLALLWRKNDKGHHYRHGERLECWPARLELFKTYTDLFRELGGLTCTPG